MPFGDLSAMPVAALKAYLRDLPKHRALLTMLWIDAARFPYLNEHAQRERLQQLERETGAGSATASGGKEYILNTETQTFEEVK